MTQQNTDIKLDFNELYLKTRADIRYDRIDDKTINQNMLTLLKLASTEQEKTSLHKMAIADLDVLAHYQIIASFGSINDEEKLKQQFQKLTTEYLASIKEAITKESISERYAFGKPHYQLLTAISLNAIALANIQAINSKELIVDFFKKINENTFDYAKLLSGKQEIEYFLNQMQYALWVLDTDSESAKDFLINQHNPEIHEDAIENDPSYNIPYLDLYYCRYAVAALADMPLNDEQKQNIAVEFEQLIPNIRCLNLRQFILLSCDKLRNKNDDTSICIVLNDMEYDAPLSFVTLTNESINAKQIIENILAQPQQTPQDIEIVFSYLYTWFNEVYDDDTYTQTPEYSKQSMHTLKALMSFDFKQCETMFAPTTYMHQILGCAIHIHDERQIPETKATLITLINLCDDINRQEPDGSLSFTSQIHYYLDRDILDAYIEKGLDLNTIDNYSDHSVTEAIQKWLKENKTKNDKYLLLKDLITAKKKKNDGSNTHNSTNWFKALLNKLF